MLCGRLIVILTIALLASARPSPELSLEEIEKELEKLSTHENDATDVTSESVNDQAKSTKEDGFKKTENELPKDLTSKTREVPIKKLDVLEKSAVKPEQKKDALTKKISDKDEKKTAASADSVAESPKHQAKQDFKDSAAYRRFMELDAANSHNQPSAVLKPGFPEIPFKRTHDYQKYDKFPLLTKSRTYYDIPARRTYDATFSKQFDQPPRYDFQGHRRNYLTSYDPVEFMERISADHTVSDSNRQGFLPNSNPNVDSRRLPSDMTRAERVSSWSGGGWVPDSKPVKVPEKLPPPAIPDVTSRLNNDVREQLNNKELEDLIHGKGGITDLEKRKRYLLDQLEEKIKSKVAEAHKRGIKIPAKIMNFLWDYENRRGMEAKM